MNVSLTPELEKLVNRKVKSGRYQTASEVVREALRALEERDQVAAMRLHELRKEIQKGLKGKATPFDPEETKREARRRIAAAKLK
jgi:antitoxin ParD1/3/4